MHVSWSCINAVLTAVACKCRTLVMPYMVDGCITVMSGVRSRGVLGPNTAMVDGAYTFRLCCAASSSTFCSATRRLRSMRQHAHWALQQDLACSSTKLQYVSSALHMSLVKQCIERGV